jgi:uncharacterized membrane protein YphA (DoxX/SURF4 family)
MHRMLKGEARKRRTSIGEYVLLLLMGVFAFMTAGELHNRGIPHKWATAIMGTLVTFGIVIYLCRRMWTRWAFWVAIGICLAAHTIVTWVFFEYVLYGVERFSILFWYPVMLVEIFLFLIATVRLQLRLSVLSLPGRLLRGQVRRGNGHSKEGWSFLKRSSKPSSHGNNPALSGQTNCRTGKCDPS